MKHKEEYFVRYPNTEKWVEKTAEFFFTNFEVVGYLMEHSFKSLIN